MGPCRRRESSPVSDFLRRMKNDVYCVVPTCHMRFSFQTPGGLEVEAVQPRPLPNLNPFPARPSFFSTHSFSNLLSVLARLPPPTFSEILSAIFQLPSVVLTHMLPSPTLPPRSSVCLTTPVSNERGEFPVACRHPTSSDTEEAYMSPYAKTVHKLGRFKWASPKAKARTARKAGEQMETRGKSHTDRKMVRSLQHSTFPPPLTILS